MKAAVISCPGPPEVLKIEERPKPAFGPVDVLIRVKAAGVNRADLIQREGRYPAPPDAPADIPGLEVAGLVESVGAEVRRWRSGDAVCALLAGGGYAENAAVNGEHCLPVPRGLSFVEAAALPEAVFTVWHNVFQRGRLTSGERFLVHGGSSGIGLAAIQLAHVMGARAFATAGNEEKRDLLFALFGSDRLIVADGVDQFVRKQKRCDWTKGVPARQIVTLKKSL